MATFDYDVVIIGSGFGGSVAALRAAEKGYRVGVMEAGRRWKDADIPKTNWDLKHYVWFPQQSCTGFKGYPMRSEICLSRIFCERSDRPIAFDRHPAAGPCLRVVVPERLVLDAAVVPEGNRVRLPTA
jgi:choline dehydrogenase-like flavoprotein